MRRRSRSAQLKPIEKGGVVTAGNASQQNDAAAACLVVAEDQLEKLGLEPMGWFVGWAAAGVEPSRMGIGPVPAVERLFAAHRPRLEGHRPRRTQRGLRAAGAGRAQGLELERRRQAQRQRLGHFARPPDRRHRRSHPRQPHARDAAPRSAATASRPCASAAARASPPSSNAPPDRAAIPLSASHSRASCAAARPEKPGSQGGGHHCHPASREAALPPQGGGSGSTRSVETLGASPRGIVSTNPLAARPHPGGACPRAALCADPWAVLPPQAGEAFRSSPPNRQNPAEFCAAFPGKLKRNKHRERGEKLFFGAPKTWRIMQSP